MYKLLINSITSLRKKTTTKKSKIGKPSSSLLRAVCRVGDTGGGGSGEGGGGERGGFHNRLFNELWE